MRLLHHTHCPPGPPCVQVVLALCQAAFQLDAVNHSLFSTTDFWHQKNTDYNNSPFHISQCFVLKLSDLQSVNVGLFDQYFRLTGK